jgi:hypothetical protein
MAFDHADSDAVFEKIKQTLNGVSVQAIRVDRVEHNDDIDDRIIAEIKGSDLALADLTYARPSVYFEAGFAQRCIPVIYTVRRDHFRPRSDDPNGNFRVHFDLQMKNIIGWRTPNDEQFQTRLRARILKVVAPLFAAKLASDGARVKTASFAAKSFQERWGLLYEIARKYFSGLEYHIVELAEDSNGSEDFTPATLLRQPFCGTIVGTKREGGTFRFLFFQVLQSITKASVQDYRYGLIRFPLYRMKIFNHPRWTPAQLKEDIVICSFGRGGASRLTREIPYLRC